jgi:hypothetical protein
LGPLSSSSFFAIVEPSVGPKDRHFAANVTGWQAI